MYEAQLDFAAHIEIGGIIDVKIVIKDLDKAGPRNAKLSIIQMCLILENQSFWIGLHSKQ